MNNNIANNIEVGKTNLFSLFSNKRYRIEVFQRAYKWKREQVEALISDLTISFFSSFNSTEDRDVEKFGNYYMGPIVLCVDGSSLSIIDGQQRLTSFTLLIIFLKHLQVELEITGYYKKEFNNFIFVNKNFIETLVLDIKSRENIINHLWKNPKEKFTDIGNDESVFNIISRYEDIEKLFPTELKEKEVLPIFIEWLINKVIMVEVKAFTLENAYTIFETMNGRGLPLNPTEMLKGYLLSKIEGEEKSNELNDLLQKRIFELKSITGSEDADLDFFKAWLRSKYAITIRQSKEGSKNEDFEIIGSQFHTWVQKYPEKIGLETPDDYYFFLQSDFDFYSDIYKQIFQHKNYHNEIFTEIYISNFYTIADSLTYPLYFSSILKTDTENLIFSKIRNIGKFIDIYTNIRIISGKTVTHSSIRNSIYEFVKEIRNLNLQSLNDKLFSELEKNLNPPYSFFNILHTMDNWGYYHYFFARIKYYLEIEEYNFKGLLRSRRQSSYILERIFYYEDDIFNETGTFKEKYLNSVANFCLMERNNYDNIVSLAPTERLNYLIENNYLIEMNGFEQEEIDFKEFLDERDFRLGNLASEIWNYKIFKEQKL
jgi:uncharacterized protein with ParB-like and HNH nuclease domain